MLARDIIERNLFQIGERYRDFSGKRDKIVLHFTRIAMEMRSYLVLLNCSRHGYLSLGPCIGVLPGG